MTYTLANILSKTRSQSNQNPNVSAFPAAVEASYIDDAQSMIFDELLQYRPDILSHYYDLTTTGAERYYLPTYMSIRFAYEDILMVEDVTNSDSPLMTLPTDWQDRMYYVYRGVPANREPWSIRDEYIEFPSKPSGEIYRIWYTRRPVGLFYGTTAAGAATTITFPATPTFGELVALDDYYIGMKVYNNGETRVISDYVASTRVATVEAAWVTTPLNTHTMSLISPLPERLHSLIPDVAAMMIRAKVSDDDIGAIRVMIRETFDKYLMRISTPQTQASKQIRRNPRF
jgi:hypothetical protein